MNTQEISGRWHQIRGKVKDSARQRIEQVTGQAREGYQRAEHLVQRHPAESLAAVFGLGLVTGVVVGLLLRSDA